MRRIRKPVSGLRGYGKNSPFQIIPYLPDKDLFFDSRHWTFCFTDEILPFSVTTKISSNNQQFLKIYEKNKKDASD